MPPLQDVSEQFLLGVFQEVDAKTKAKGTLTLRNFVQCYQILYYEASGSGSGGGNGSGSGGKRKNNNSNRSRKGGSSFRRSFGMRGPGDALSGGLVDQVETLTAVR